jgi:hypothetical protein
MSSARIFKGDSVDGYVQSQASAYSEGYVRLDSM